MNETTAMTVSKVKLSLAAQAVMDAYVSEDRAGRLAVAAALRAAAGVITFPGPESLLAIATELEEADPQSGY
jgi:hypothetical protein